MIIRLPNCCAMPHDNREGKRYRCATCYAVYMVVDGEWTLCDPIIDLTEFPESVHDALKIPDWVDAAEVDYWRPAIEHDDIHNPYDLTTDERTL